MFELAEVPNEVSLGPQVTRVHVIASEYSYSARRIPGAALDLMRASRKISNASTERYRKALVFEAMGAEIRRLSARAVTVDVVAEACCCSRPERRREAGADQGSPCALLHYANSSFYDPVGGGNARIGDIM